MRSFTIAGRTITDDSPAFVCAEIGHNHMGKLDLAREMFRVAKECGADAVKLQKRSPVFYAALRAKGLTEYADVREGRELSRDDYCMLNNEAREIGLAFVVTAFDVESLEFVATLGAHAVKLASCGIHNYDLLAAAVVTGIPLLISTGCSDRGEVDRAVWGIHNAALLQCTSAYPCPPWHLNLGVLAAYRRDYPSTIVGLSSHATENAYEPLAYRLGARIFEKHFTLDKNMGAGDHANSLDPAGLRDLVARLRAPCPDYDPDEYLMVYGDDKKKRLDCEAEGMRRLNPWGV